MTQFAFEKNNFGSHEGDKLEPDWNGENPNRRLQTCRLEMMTLNLGKPCEGKGGGGRKV